MVLNYLTYVMMAFAMLSFISIAIGNVLLGLATALFLVYVYKNGIKIEEEHKSYYYAYGFFVFTLLLSALFSGDLKKGLGQAKKAIKESKEYKPWFTHYHSNIFQMLAENGLTGLLGYLCFAGWYVIKNFKEFITEKYPRSLIIAASVLGVFIQGITEYNFGNSAVMKAFWLVVGLLLVIKHKC